MELRVEKALIVHPETVVVCGRSKSVANVVRIRIVDQTSSAKAGAV